MSDGNQNPGILIPTISDCHVRVRQALQDIVRRLGTSSTPTYSTLTLESLDASKLVQTDSDKALASADIYDFVAGTTNQINTDDDGDGTMALSTPQDIHAGATAFTITGLVLNTVASLPATVVVGKVVRLLADGELYLGKDD